MSFATLRSPWYVLLVNTVAFGYADLDDALRMQQSFEYVHGMASFIIGH